MEKQGLVDFIHQPFCVIEKFPKNKQEKYLKRENAINLTNNHVIVIVDLEY